MKLINSSEVTKKLKITRQTLWRWRSSDILVGEIDPDDQNNMLYYDIGVDAVAKAILDKVSKDKYQQYYDNAVSIDPGKNNTVTTLFSVPNKNLNKLAENHAATGITPQGDTYIKPNVVTWVAYLKARFGEELVADEDTGKLWLEDYSDDKYTLNELPDIPELMYDASRNWGIDDSRVSHKKVEDAIQQVAHMVPTVNPYYERLLILKDQWDGRPRLDTIFQELLASPQDPDILKMIARTWFNGAVHNWTREKNDLVFPMMLDLNATAQGTGKSFFFNIINGIMCGADGKLDSAISGDLNDPANLYPQLLGKAVVNDDEHRVYNASQPIGRQASGADVNATYKNWITLDTLEWTLKHSNAIKKVPVRYVLGRTSNVSKPYSDNDTVEVDRRFLTVRGGAFKDITLRSVKDYTNYMKQVLGEAMFKFTWDSSKDANMNPKLRDAMRIEQIQGSKQGDGWEFITEIMTREISYDFYSTSIIDIQAYLSGTAPHLSTGWHDITNSKNSRFVRPRAIAGALYKMSQLIGTKTTKDQAEALTQKWLVLNGFTDYDEHDFKWKGAHYQGDFMINTKNDQYNTSVKKDRVDDILNELELLEPMLHNDKELLKNISTVCTNLQSLNAGVIEERGGDIQIINDKIAHALKTLIK